MMSRFNGETRSMDNTLETINAAATAIAIASTENRVALASVQKRRWRSCWSIYWCFGSHKQNKRIASSALYPEPPTPRTEPPATRDPTQTTPSNVLPFVAPPSSPASFLHSEPPSAAQSPPPTSISSTNMYSPSGPASIFAIGPYAHETQLVSPPVFSSFTTEPSTAPFTPPPESVHLTTPSSPEVPFARLLGPTAEPTSEPTSPGFPFPHYEFQPGSPMGQLISPSSGCISCSGTSSPFLDREFTSTSDHHHLFLEFRTRDPHNELGSGTLTPDTVRPRSRDEILLERQDSDLGPLMNVWRNNETKTDPRVSFEITAEQVARCIEKELAAALPTVVVSASPLTESDNNLGESWVGETSNRHQKNRTITFGSIKDFDFNSLEEGDKDNPNAGSDWSADREDIGKEGSDSNNWSFFPLMQSGVI